MASSGQPDNVLHLGPRSAGGQWQVDIPSLAGIVTRLGAEGLKKLQMSGVDIHTLGCLLVLGEIAPASNEFRKKLQRSREEQRSQHWFIHTMVEYGSGTNCVVDELLKTRARENVLALLTTVTSVLEVGATQVALNLPYEKLQVPSNSTPSRLE
jgi:hypothetical protein